jgi:histone H3/H4
MADYIAKAPIRRLMKRQGADLVAADALDRLIEYLENVAGETTEAAMKVTQSDNRKRITEADVREAAQNWY